MASPKFERIFHRSRFWIRERYFDIKFGLEQWLLKKTTKYRIRKSKKIILSSIAYCDSQMCWDDIDVQDQKGRWLCSSSFGLCSKKSWEFDNQVNRDIGQPEEPWRDVVEHPDWTTYYVPTEYITIEQRVEVARKHLAKVWGDMVYDKDIEVRYTFQSQKSIDDQIKQVEEWKANGSKPFKIAFADGAKESFEKVFGEEVTQDIMESTEQRNAEISEEENRKKLDKDDDFDFDNRWE